MNFTRPVVIVPLCLLLLAGCEGRGEKDMKTVCKEGGDSNATCSCIYGKLEDIYSPDDLEKMYEGKKTPPNGFNSNASQAALECRAKDSH